MNENKICPVGTKVQSLIFSKEKFTENSAKEWAENHNYKFGYADEKEETFRIRQKNPKFFDSDSFRTIDITDGIQADIACPKKKMEDGGEFVFITDRQVNDECVLELVELIRSEKSISSWFIDKIAFNLVIVFDNEIMIDDVSKFEDILLKLDSCHDVFKPEITFEYNKETKVILIPLLTDDISVGEFEDGGSVGNIRFTSYGDALQWIENESKKYKSKNHFYASDEYKIAYPIIKKLAEEENKISKKTFIEKAINTMKSVGVNFGDMVYFDNVSPFGYAEEYTGKIINKNGVPYVELDEGQKTISGKKIVIWNKGWLKNKEKYTDGGRIESKYNIDFGDGFVGEIRRITTTKKSGSIYSLFSEKLDKNIEDGFFISFEVKDNKITYNNFRHRKSDLSIEIENDQFLYEKSIDISDVPKILIDYINDNYLTNKTKTNETLQGGAGDKLTIEDIATKHNVSVEYANEQLNKGIKIESEHTTDVEKQTEIALDHLSEFIEYYNELEKMEEKLKEKEAKKDSFEREGFQTGKGKLYEFFTPQEIADKMVALAQHYGFKGGRVLEPAAGNGRLLKNLSNADITAFEINIDNYEFLKKQFPNAEIYNSNFEKSFLKAPRYNSLIDAKATKTWLSGYPFDLVLANPPYGKFSGLYSSYFKFKGQAEHFFILQTLYLLKSGGIGVYLVPSSFLRNGITYNEIKKTIFGMAKLTDAYRLPVNIFKDTQIGTDIIVLTKK